MMTDPILSFATVNSELSRQIYKSFCSKCVINKKIYKESSAGFVENPQYLELVENMQHYELLYVHIGYRLTHDSLGEYFYIKVLDENEENDESFDETSLKIMAILSLFAKIATQRQQSISTLMEPIQGVANSDLEIIDNHPEMLSILMALKLKNASEAIEFLKKYGFAFKVLSNRHVLSKGALVMIDALIEHFKQADEIS